MKSQVVVYVVFRQRPPCDGRRHGGKGQRQNHNPQDETQRKAEQGRKPRQDQPQGRTTCAPWVRLVHSERSSHHREHENLGQQEQACHNDRRAEPGRRQDEHGNILIGQCGLIRQRHRQVHGNRHAGRNQRDQQQAHRDIDGHKDPPARPRPDIGACNG